MTRRPPIAWLQLRHEKLRTLTAVLGVVVSVVLIFMQLGFREACFDGAVRYHRELDFDLVMLSPKMAAIINSSGFTERRLFQALGSEGVERVAPLMVSAVPWRNPDDPAVIRNIFVVGANPDQRVFKRADLQQAIEATKLADRVYFDRFARPEFGDVGAHFDRDGEVRVEVASRDVVVAGIFELGTSFGIDGSLLTSDLNFRRLLPHYRGGRVDVGLISLEEGADTEAVRDRLRGELAGDVRVLTRDEWIANEVAYWNSTTPVGYVFGFGAIVGLFVGSIIVYQILFTDVSSHLGEYATLKAMGYRDSYLYGIVLGEAILLALLGFAPGLLTSSVLFDLAEGATGLPLRLTPQLVASVFALTLTMCCVSGLLTLRKVQRLDPAEVF